MKITLFYIFTTVYYTFVFANRCKLDITSFNSSFLTATPRKEFFREDESVNISCIEGYASDHETNIRHCGKDGLWNSQDLPVCKRIVCIIDVFMKPHMKVTAYKGQYFLHETPNVSCTEGYYLRGGAPTCEKRGWAFPGMMFHCEASYHCKLPKDPHAIPHLLKAYNYWDGVSLEYGDSVYLECQQGYRHKSFSKVSCGLGGNLEQNLTQVICEEITCDVESIVEPHMVLPDKSIFHLNETANINCDVGYLLHGLNPTCGEKGWFFSGMNMSCDAITCIVPNITHSTAHLHKAFDNNALELFEYQDTVRYECDKGYSIKDLSEVTCGPDGNLQQNINEVRCEVIRCQKPYLGKNLNITDYKEDYSYEEEIYFRCEGGFRLRGIATAMCGDGNRFNITEIPICEDDAMSNHLIVSTLTLGASVGGGIALMLILFGLFVCIRKKYRGTKYEKTKINTMEQHLYTDIIHNRQTVMQDREPTYNYIN
ncbi:sushi, von Willebrand factor type A, EGF and pentraxin domain-containing protein 1-like, partial [Saccostrea cucullata]|uniref:sushi, von Willebrand factor type A, EGF and pentraxin domain-containing protein 1-like n=1 Tax=Saccostrea cuccullata TaxID=36930 RepID=UPI002ED247F8